MLSTQHHGGVLDAHHLLYLLERSELSRRAASFQCCITTMAQQFSFHQTAKLRPCSARCTAAAAAVHMAYSMCERYAHKPEALWKQPSNTWCSRIQCHCWHGTHDAVGGRQQCSSSGLHRCRNTPSVHPLRQHMMWRTRLNNSSTTDGGSSADSNSSTGDAWGGVGGNGSAGGGSGRGSSSSGGSSHGSPASPKLPVWYTVSCFSLALDCCSSASNLHRHMVTSTQCALALMLLCKQTKQQDRHAGHWRCYCIAHVNR